MPKSSEKLCVVLTFVITEGPSWGYAAGFIWDLVRDFLLFRFFEPGAGPPILEEIIWLPAAVTGDWKEVACFFDSSVKLFYPLFAAFEVQGICNTLAIILFWDEDFSILCSLEMTTWGDIWEFMRTMEATDCLSKNIINQQLTLRRNGVSSLSYWTNYSLKYILKVS